MTTALKPSSRYRWLQWSTIALIVVVLGLNFIDRVTVSIANTTIRHDLGLSAAAVGGLVSAWSIAYALAQMPSGYLLDRFGVRKTMSVSLFLWSIAQAAGGISTGFGSLAASRLALGLAEGPGYLACARVTRNWFHAKDRGLPTSCYVNASVAGPAIAPLLLTFLMLRYNWHVMFIIMGVFGMLLAVLTYAVYRNAEHSNLSASDMAYVRANNNEPEIKVGLRQFMRLFKFGTVWGLTGGTFGLGYIFWIFYGWLPAFLQMKFHVRLASLGILAGIPWLGGILGGVLCGYLSDRMARGISDPLRARKLPTVVGLLIMAVSTGFMALSNTLGPTLFFAFWVIFGGIFCTTGLWALKTVVAPQAYVGSLASIPNCAAYLGGTLSPLLTGYLVDRTGSFTPGLVVATVIGLLSCASFQLGIKKAVPKAELERGLVIQTVATVNSGA